MPPRYHRGTRRTRRIRPISSLCPAIWPCQTRRIPFGTSLESPNRRASERDDSGLGTMTQSGYPVTFWFDSSVIGDTLKKEGTRTSLGTPRGPM